MFVDQNNNKKDEGKKDERKFQSIVCSNCRESGISDNRECPVCNGRGVVFWFNKTLFYWGKKISVFNILENKIEKIARNIINGTLFIFGFVGLGFLAFYVYETGAEKITTASFWMNQSLTMLIFWFSIFTDMYLLYRLDKESSLQEKVQKKVYGAEENISLTGNLWEKIKRLPMASRVDISKSFNVESLKIIEESWKLAGKFNHPEIRPVHILASLLFSSKIDLIFARLGVDIKELAKKVNRLLNKQEFLEFESGGERFFSGNSKEVFFNAYLEAYLARDPQVDVIDLLLAVVKGDSGAKEILYDLKVDLNMVRNVVLWIRINESLIKQSKSFRKSAIFKPKSGMDRAMTAVATPFMDRFSQDLTLLAKFGYLEPCIGREKEIENIFRAMEASGQSVILSGNPGVGKTTIINGIARHMVSEDVPEIIKDKRLVSLSIARLVSGADAGEAQGRLMQIMDEIRRSGNIVLFIPDIQGQGK